MTDIHLLDTVMLRQDLPQFGLVAGEMGAVVEVHDNGEAFEVEFVDPNGSTYNLRTLKSQDLLVPHLRGVPWRGQKMAA